jgi:hypothetical protein
MNATVGIDRLTSRALGLYRCSLLAGLTSASIAALAAYPVHLGQPSLVLPGLTAASGLAALDLFLAYKEASRLATNPNLKKRVGELTKKAAKKVEEAFKTLDMFRELRLLIIKAAEMGAMKEAIDGQNFLISCFGYADSPTLTHGQALEGRRLANRDEAIKEPVIRFSKTIEAFKKRQGMN